MERNTLMNKNFAVFILTHGRPNNVLTYKTLRKSGYTGAIYLVVDNLDESINDYKKNYKNNVIVFDKPKMAKMVDNGDNFNDLRTTTHVRNAIFDIAENLGLNYFLALDDDYSMFMFRINQNMEYPSGKYLSRTTLDRVFELTIDFLNESKAASVCFSQGGDWFGGKENSMAHGFKLKRKAMNSFFCSTKNRFWFISRMNEDVNTYLTLGSTGVLFLTTPIFSLDQESTQANEGGMTDTYLDNGTYVKSFTTVMYCPSFAKVSSMGRTHRRIHHSINWKNAVPVILDESVKK